MGFGSDGHGYELVDHSAHGLHTTWIEPGRAVLARTPPNSTLPDAIFPVAFVPGSYVDVEVGVTIRFEPGAPPDCAAGFWLRSTDDSALTVMLFPGGHVSVGIRADSKFSHKLASATRPGGAGGEAVLQARCVKDRVDVAIDGRPLISATDPDWGGVSGYIDLRAQVGETEASIVFASPWARLVG